MSATDDRLARTILALTRERGPDSSICPSDAARAVGGENWRELMARTRAVARELAREGHVAVTSRGRVLSPDGTWHGPVRIRVADSSTDHSFE
jgi:hypothetical protein